MWELSPNCLYREVLCDPNAISGPFAQFTSHDEDIQGEVGGFEVAIWLVVRRLSTPTRRETQSPTRAVPLPTRRGSKHAVNME